MAFEVHVPRLGWSMEQGTFVGWKRREGDVIRAGDVLFELEGDKATQEIEAMDSGILCIPPDAPRPGTTVSVGTVLAYLLVPGERPPWDVEPMSAGNAGAHPTAAEPTFRPSAPDVAGAEPPGAIAAQRATTLPKRETGATAAVSPRARRVAAELGINVQHLTGSGRRGRVREQDVLAAGARRGGNEITPDAGDIAKRTSIEITARRRVIAERMHTSAQRTAPVTLTTRADASRLVSLREALHAADSTQARMGHPTFTDILVVVSAHVLQRHPLMAGWSDGERIWIPTADGIDIGIAVDTDGGLLVPVIRNALHLSLADVTEQTRELVERARAGRLQVADMQGGVFTITNLGAYGIDAFTPLINYPQTSVLGLGAIRREPVVTSDGRIEPQHVVTLSLTFDHRVVDGAPAARFLADVRAAVEEPADICGPVK